METTGVQRDNPGEYEDDEIIDKFQKTSII